eukprot:Gb_05255 [translate_table: standard]
MDFSEPSRRKALAVEDFDEGELLPRLPEDLALMCLARVPIMSLWGVCRAWQRVLYESTCFQTLRASLGLPAIQWLYALIRTDEGFFSWFAYDPLASTWRKLPAMPGDVEFQLTSPGHIGRFHAVQCTSTPGKMIVVAGSRLVKHETTKFHLQPALDRPLVFEAEKRQWSRGAPFQVPRKWCACGVVQNKLYLASGCGFEWDVSISKSAELYDLETQSWQPVEPLKSSKFSGEPISAVTIGKKLHMVSGKGVMMREGIVFDPENNVCSAMPRGLRDGWTGPCVGVCERFYALEESIGRLKVYDEQRDSWVTIVEDKKLRGLSQLAASNGKICGIVAGGSVNRIITVDVFNKPPKIFEVGIPMGWPIAVQVLARMGPGKLEI